MTYKRSRRGDAAVDRAAGQVVRAAGGEVRDFTPLGGDERQFCSPGFDLPVGVLSRTPQDEFPGYHSSADDLDARPAGAPRRLVRGLPRGLRSARGRRERGNATYVNLNPKGEPQLGKRGLYRAVGGGSFAEGALLWVLNLSDGRHDLQAIAERSGLPFSEIRAAADQLLDAGLLESAEDGVS